MMSADWAVLPTHLLRPKWPQGLETLDLEGFRVSWVWEGLQMMNEKLQMMNERLQKMSCTDLCTVL